MTEKKIKETNVLTCRVHGSKYKIYEHRYQFRYITSTIEIEAAKKKRYETKQENEWMAHLRYEEAKTRWIENRVIKKSIKNEKQQPKWWTTRHDKREIWYDVWSLNRKKAKQKKWISNDLECGIAF